MPSPPLPPYSAPEASEAQGFESTSSITATSAKRERSTSPSLPESGRDAKRANLGEMTNANAQGTSPAVKSESEDEPVQAKKNDTHEPKLEVSTGVEASASR
jgi:hypothetical protein